MKMNMALVVVVAVMTSSMERFHVELKQTLKFCSSLQTNPEVANVVLVQCGLSMSTSMVLYDTVLPIQSKLL